MSFIKLSLVSYSFPGQKQLLFFHLFSAFNSWCETCPGYIDSLPSIFHQISDALSSKPRSKMLARETGGTPCHHIHHKHDINNNKDNNDSRKHINEILSIDINFTFSMANINISNDFHLNINNN